MAKKTRAKGKKKSGALKKAPKRSAASRSRRAAPARGSRRSKVKPGKKPARARAKSAASIKRKASASKKRSPRPSAKKSSRATRRPKAAKKVAAPKPTRLAPRKRHVVESDEPRERAGDANEEAFVGTDTKEDEAQELGEEFVRSVTSGEEAESEMEEEEEVEEEGGPFVVTSASTEYGFGTDESNPADAEKAPFPQVSPAVSTKVDGEDEDQ